MVGRGAAHAPRRRNLSPSRSIGPPKFPPWMDGLIRLDPRVAWRSARSHEGAFWLLCVYVVVE